MTIAILLALPMLYKMEFWKVYQQINALKIGAVIIGKKQGMILRLLDLTLLVTARAPKQQQEEEMLGFCIHLTDVLNDKPGKRTQQEETQSVVYSDPEEGGGG